MLRGGGDFRGEWRGEEVNGGRGGEVRELTHPEGPRAV